MESTIQRKATSFRLRTDILEQLKKQADESHRSLNNYVEMVLYHIAYPTPNAETLQAMADIEAGKDLKKVDMSNKEAFLKSVME